MHSQPRCVCELHTATLHSNNSSSLAALCQAQGGSALGVASALQTAVLGTQASVVQNMQHTSYTQDKYTPVDSPPIPVQPMPCQRPYVDTHTCVPDSNSMSATLHESIVLGQALGPSLHERLT